MYSSIASVLARCQLLALLLLLVRPTYTQGKSEENSKNRNHHSVESAVEERLLTMLGFNGRPRPSPRQRHNVPLHMYQLYRRSQDSSQASEQDGCSLAETKVPGNIVRSVPNKGSVKTNGCKEQITVSFDLSAVSQREDIKLAELYFGGFSGRNHAWKSTSIFRVTAYVDRLRMRDDVMGNARKGHLQKLDSQICRPGGRNCPPLNITMAARKWLLRHAQNARVYITIDRLRSRSLSLTCLVPKHSQWSLVLVSHDGSKCPVRTKRDLSRKEGRTRSSSICRPRSLYIDFRDLGWSDWIVAPMGYNAKYCKGDCPFPLNEYLNGTNHAIFQAMANSIDARAVPEVSCIPTRYAPISVLYIDSQDSVILRRYENMVVDVCGCQ